ncbi:pyridoxal phosphate-dependent decarboxylase family protein [Allosphingosinicella deserti]|uniref:Pyridoxal-dependent decarboxylase n=1 Tax=Allosphingosinicella deserti TaxID=2116704 RepID=A0A2P7QNS6_9SPHN|nr:pyridoxal-dependent decarboxylase [Sphingomonas deserti]PSJ39606.1 pyridoxal-dependent decarboxylase [Sphingomonas deserti]
MTGDADADGDPGMLADVAALAARHIRARRSACVAPARADEILSERLAAYDFAEPLDGVTVAADLLDLLGGHAVRSDHPAYFGLFNPPPLVAAVAGDIVTAAVNPQLAAWGHAPAAAEIERKLVELFGSLVWRGDDDAAGTFTSGGSEANHSAVLLALARRYPDWAQHGLPCGVRPVLYVSAQSHLAWMKIARAVGLGDRAVRLVEPEDGLALTGEALRRAVLRDGEADPLMLVGTAGTTAHGAIDDLAGFGQVARELGIHMHVDAAWAGGALLSPRGRDLMPGLDLADTVTIDPHKWLAVPMGAGLFLSRTWHSLDEAFGVTTGYMPATVANRRDPYVHSMQWSRRFTGGKLFMALATMGLPGYARMIERQIALGDRLRSRLREDGWTIANDTALPLVCFSALGAEDVATKKIEDAVVGTGRAWLSSVRCRGRLVLRACITSFEANEGDVDLLLGLLNDAREPVAR